MIEDRFAEWIDPAQHREGSLVKGRNHPVQNHPLPVFPKLIFQLYH
jgi:hypothetical protein